MNRSDTGNPENCVRVLIGQVDAKYTNNDAAQGRPGGEASCVLAAIASPSAAQDTTMPTTEPTEDIDDGDQSYLLPRGSKSSVSVYHRGQPNDDEPLCSGPEWVELVPEHVAKDEADRECRKCRSKRGEMVTRTCPNCDREIGTNAWVRHFRSCNGDDANREDSQ